MLRSRQQLQVMRTPGHSTGRIFHKSRQNVKNCTNIYRHGIYSCLTFFTENAGKEPGLGRERSWGQPGPFGKGKAGALLFLWALFLWVPFLWVPFLWARLFTGGFQGQPAYIPSEMICAEMIQLTRTVSAPAIKVVTNALRHSIGRAGAEGA